MKIIRSPKQMQALALSVKRKGKTIGLVPTMGALHEGHLSLVKRARAGNDIVVVSVFVNPAQFGPNEDYLRYPRPFSADRKLCNAAGVDVIFAPDPAGMYPGGYRTYITVEGLSDLMCGKFRPGHFRGVATVVAKLFNISLPDRAYFGMKDFQQLAILKRMAADLNFPVTIVPCPIVREPSGLALSSRNRYLTPAQAGQSAAISHALLTARDLIQYQAPDPKKIIQKIRSLISKIPSARIEYATVCDPETLEPVSRIHTPVLIAVAVWVGKTRLIDNILVEARRA